MLTSPPIGATPVPDCPYSSNGKVWDGYFGVYHLEDSTGAAKDSSSYANDRVNAGMSVLNSPTVVSSGMAGQTKATSYSSTSTAEKVLDEIYNSGNSIRVQTSSLSPES